MTRTPAFPRLITRLRRIGLGLAALALGLGLHAATAQVTISPNVLQPRNSIVIDRTTPSATILRQLQSGTVTRVPIERTARPTVTLPQGSQRPIPVPLPGPIPMPRRPPPPEATLLMPVQFDYDSDVLRPEARAILDSVAHAMRDPSLGGATFLIEGHTDSTGSWDYNQNLSERRALSVARYLVSRGVPHAALMPVGYSWNRLLPSLHPTDGRNRRVEIGRLAS